MRLAVDGDCHGHSVNTLGLHHRLYSGVHHGLDLILCHALARGEYRYPSDDGFQPVHVGFVRR
ncbi:hypothetical protein D3C84_1031770 [compost metagenome]